MKPSWETLFRIPVEYPCWLLRNPVGKPNLETHLRSPDAKPCWKKSLSQLDKHMNCIIVLIITAVDRYQAICNPLGNCTWTPKRSQVSHLYWYFFDSVNIGNISIFNRLCQNCPKLRKSCYASFKDTLKIEKCLFYSKRLFNLIIRFWLWQILFWLNILRKSKGEQQIFNLFDISNFYAKTLSSLNF